MNIGDKVKFWGNEYTAVPFDENDTLTLIPIGDDNQCRICALEPNYCKMMDYCHAEPPFIFVKTLFIEAMKPFKI